MPELPEVETIKTGIAPYLEGATVTSVRTSKLALREPIPSRELKKFLISAKFGRIWRRSKYIVCEAGPKTLLIHLGMTGNVLILDDKKDQHNHTHMVLGLSRKSQPTKYLHYIDPRRFGRINLIDTTDLHQHPLLASLGPEPLEQQKLGDFLWKKAKNAKRPIKTFVMDGHVVVGVGNIYASESLFEAGINPTRLAKDVKPKEFHALARMIKKTLRRAIKAGGTSLKDFKDQDGNPGYFKIELKVYGRAGEACKVCDAAILLLRQGGRATYYCPCCQP